MSDLFHERVPFEFIDRIFETIRPLLNTDTKSSQNDPNAWRHISRAVTAPYNAWLGTSVENRKYGLPRIAVLQRIQSSVRFLSIEPLLEDIEALDLTGISWVIVGGK